MVRGKKLQPGKIPVIELPFKPFTLDEVAHLLQIPGPRLDDMVRGLAIQMKVGTGAVGLDYQQTFALFCAHRYATEGAGPERSGGIYKFVSNHTLDELAAQFEKGNTFPGIMELTGLNKDVMIPAPHGRMGAMLNLKTLHLEFRHNLSRLFPGTDN